MTHETQSAHQSEPVAGSRSGAASPTRSPNFVVIGAAKSGTTALYHYLVQHPQVFMTPMKETNFFALQGEEPCFRGPRDNEFINHFSITRPEDYAAQFEGVRDEIAVGEASPLYIYHPLAAQRIHESLPDAKIVAILRHPVERAYSAFLHMLRDEREPCRNFQTALKQENERIKANWEFVWHYQRGGFYAQQLKPYFELFERERIKVYLYEDFTQRPQWLMRDLFEFLGVDENFVPRMGEKFNESQIRTPHSPWIDQMLHSPHPLKMAVIHLLPREWRRHMADKVQTRNFAKPPLTPKVRAQLLAAYRDDILELQNLLGRDLSSWLKPQSF